MLGNEILREFGRHKAETQLMTGDITPCKPRKKKVGQLLTHALSRRYRVKNKHLRPHCRLRCLALSALAGQALILSQLLCYILKSEWLDLWKAKPHSYRAGHAACAINTQPQMPLFSMAQRLQEGVNCRCACICIIFIMRRVKNSHRGHTQFLIATVEQPFLAVQPHGVSWGSD